MSNVVIKVENLSKSYLINHQGQESYTALRDVLTNGAKNFAKKIVSPFTSNVQPLTSTQEEFFALKDVSFEIKQGDRVGIIGRNGAGKSTLLKVLSRITEPTKGRVTIDGRVASLLEVGTGFHPELTGRENIFLNGAILGMSRIEIKRKFDEIVAFAEVEKFLDTPVKRYSSGMYVRLAFAVAAHLESDILVIDEVLAVGDAQFQRKCLGKMKQVSGEGRTILFVSHNMVAISRLCERGILLQSGKKKSDSDTGSVIAEYNKELLNSKKITELYGIKDFIKIEEVGLATSSGSNECVIDEDIYIQATYVCKYQGRRMSPNFNVYTESMNLIFCSHQIKSFLSEENRKYRSVMKLPKNLLKEGLYYLDFAVGNSDPFETYAYFKHVYMFVVKETWTGETARGALKVSIPGMVSPLLEWETEVL